MQCSKCRHVNQVGAKFCEECGTALSRVCTACRTQISAKAKFCPECAQPTGLLQEADATKRFGKPEDYTPEHLLTKIRRSKAALEGERKQVTVLFADLKGSMELLADRDPEEVRKFLDPLLQLMIGIPCTAMRGQSTR